MQTNERQTPLAAHLALTRVSARGAALLLSVYMAALVFLLLGGLTLQRTSTDVKAAELSRDLQQAFYAAEAGIDQAIHQAVTANEVYAVRSVDGIPSGVYQMTMPDGTTTQYSVQDIRTEILSPRQKSVTRKVTATGRSAITDRPQTLSAYYMQSASLIGAVYANSEIAGAHPSPPAGGGCGSWLTEGSLHTGQGTPGSVKLINNSGPGDGVSNGLITVGPPDRKAPYHDLWGIWNASSGEIKKGNDPAILLNTRYANPRYSDERLKQDLFWRFGGSYEGFPGTAFGSMELPTIQPVTTPLAYLFYALTNPWTGRTELKVRPRTTLVVKPGDMYHGVREFYDGGAGDISPAGDGKIIMRLNYLQVWPDAKLVFHAPAQLYLESNTPITPDWTEVPQTPLPTTNIPTTAYLGTRSAVVAVDDATGRTIRNGVELIATRQSNAYGMAIPPGAVLIDAPAVFFGNVWAPESSVELAGNSYPDHPHPPAPGEYTTGDIGSYVYNVCPTDWHCPGTLRGVESGYVVANRLYFQGTLRVGGSKSDPFAPPNAAEAARPILMGWTSTSASR